MPPMKFALILWCLLALPLAAARLKFAEPVKKIDAELDQQQVVTEFSFTNETGEQVSIVRWDGSCDCTRAQVKGGKLQYEPGESGVLRATLDLGTFSGEIEKVIQLWLDGDPPNQPSVMLTMQVKIPVLVEVEPKTVRWEIGDEAEPKSIRIHMNHDEPIRVLSAQSNNPDFPAELKTIEEGSDYEVVITPATTTKPGIAVVHLQTDCKVPKHASQRVFAVIRNPRVGRVIGPTPGQAAGVRPGASSSPQSNRFRRPAGSLQPGDER